MGAYAPDHVVAEVRALALQGYRMPTISDKTGVPVSTVHRWLHEWESLGTEQDREMLDQERRIALLAARIYEDKLEAAAEGRESVKITEAAVSYGISRSKLHERAQRNQSPTIGQIVFIQAQSTEPTLPNSARGNGVNHDIKPTKTELLDTEGD